MLQSLGAPLLSSSMGTDSVCALSTSRVRGWLFVAATAQTVSIRKNAKRTRAYRDILNATSRLSRSAVEAGAHMANLVRLPISAGRSGKENSGAVPDSSRSTAACR